MSDDIVTPAEAPGEPAAEAPAEVTTEAITEGEAQAATDPTGVESAATSEDTPADATSDEGASPVSTPVDSESDPDAAVEDADLDATDDDELDVEQLAELVASDPKKAALELKKARKEAADGRVRARDAEQANRELYGDQADENFVSEWAALGRAFAESGDDLEAQQAVRAVFADLAGVVPTTASPVSPAEQINQLFERREQESARRAAEVAVTLEIQELGYNTEPEKGSTDEARLNVLRAHIASQPDGEKDLKKAHEATQAYRSQIFEEELAKVRESGEGMPPVASGTGSTPSTSSQDEGKKKEKVDPYEETVRRNKEWNSKGGNTTLNG